MSMREVWLIHRFTSSTYGRRYYFFVDFEHVDFLISFGDNASLISGFLLKFGQVETVTL